MRTRLSTVALLMLVVGTGCSSGAHRAGSPSATRTVISVSRAHIYGSLRELAADVPLVAVVTVGSGATKVPADERGTDGGSAVLVDVAITRLLKGEAPATIPVRLLTSAEPESDLPSALVPGASYVLFLQPFEWHPGLRSGQWTVPGGAGIYRVSASGLRLESPGPDELPADLSSIPRLAAEID